MKNGDIITCDRCNACHRLTTPKDRRTGEVVTGILVFNCNGMLRIAARRGVQVIPEIKVIEPVGAHGEQIIHKRGKEQKSHPKL